MNRIKSHFRDKKNYYILASVITVLFLIIYACYGAFPFGTKTIAHYDMYHQVLPFIGLIFDMLSGKISPVFTNYLAGGANIVGFVCYMIFNPFYLLLLPFGKANLLYSINIVFIVQIIAIALTFLWFIRKYFRLNDILQITFAFAYAISPYVLFNYTWFTWLFLYMLMPILAHYFIKMLKTGKIWGFTLTVTAMIYNCYGIGLTGQAIIFIIATVFIFSMIKDNQHRKTSMFKMLISYGIAVCFALPLLGVNAMQLTEGSRIGSLFDNFIYGQLFGGISYNINYLVTDSIALVFTVLFVIKCNKHNKFNQFLFISLLLCAIPLLIDGIQLVLCLGSYYGYNMRLSYVLTFLMMITSMLYTKNIMRRHNNIAEEKIEKYTERSISIIFCVVILLVTLCLSIWHDFLSSSLSNACSGGLVLLVYSIIPVGFIAIMVWLLYNYLKGKVRVKLFYVIMSILFVFQSLSNMFIFTEQGFSSTKEVKFLQKQSIERNINYTDRLKDFSDDLGCDTHILTNFSSFACFASQINKVPVEFSRKLGYNVSNNALSSFGGTVLSDALFNYKYYYSTSEINYPHLNLVASEKHKEKTYYLYENMLTINNAIMLPSSSNLQLGKNISDNIQALYEYMGGEGTVIKSTTLDLIISDPNNDIGQGTLVDDETKHQTVNIMFKSRDYNRIMYSSLDVFQEYCVLIPNSSALEINTESNSLESLGYVEKNKSDYEVGIQIVEPYNKKDKYEAKDITIYEINYDKVAQLIQSLNNQNVDFKYTKNGFKVTANSNNQKIVISNANINGNYITINGVKTEPNSLGLIELDLNDGENLIVSEFKFPYTKVLLIALVVGGLGLTILIVFNYYLIKYKTIKNIVYYVSLGIFGVFLTIVYFVPSVIFMVRIFMFKF